jgi:hypothetical protein
MINLTPMEHLMTIHALNCMVLDSYTPQSHKEVYEAALTTLTQPHHNFQWKLDWKTRNGITMAIGAMQSMAMIDSQHGEVVKYMRLNEKFYRYVN